MGWGIVFAFSSPLQYKTEWGPVCFHAKMKRVH